MLGCLSAVGTADMGAAEDARHAIADAIAPPAMAVCHKWEFDEPMAHMRFEGWEAFEAFLADMARMAADLDEVGY